MSAAMNLQPVHAAGPMGVPCRLRCEYLVDPLGIDVRQPRLSWEVRDRRRGARQSAYQVRVAADRRALGSAGAAIWDSGKVDSAESVHIPYQGRALISREHCWWKVRTWDAEGRPSRWSAAACWTMGLLEPADWQARWIADPAPPPPDSRAHNGYRSLPAPSADAGQWVVLDLGTLRAIDGVRFYGARPFDLIPPDAPGYLFPIRFKVEVAADASFSAAQTVVDCTQQDVVNPGSQPWTRRFAALQGRYVRLLVTRLQRCAEEGYAFALAEMEVLYGEENVALGSPVTAPDAVENATWSAERLTDGDVWPHPAGPALPLPAPLFRQEFHLAAPVRRATVYVSALGLYELRLNGQRVGDQLLAPGWTDYEQWVQYQAYDVTALLRPGQNAVGALLGDGWYAGRVAMAQVFRGRLRGIYGRQPRLLVQLEIELADGGRQTIASDAAWRSTLDGPIRSSDIYDGETYDARRALPGWDLPNFPEAGWRPVALAPGSGPERVADLCQPIRVRRELKSRSVNSPEPGLLVIDFGQCFAGWVRVRCVGRAGTVVTVRHGQVLNAAGRVHFADLRGALQTDRYILCGDPAGETLEPHFTYHGLRYVEISGLTATPDATGVVFGTDLPPAGSFACSDRTLNALWRAVDWTLRSNCMSIHTDCCDRDERLPWVIPDINQAEFYVADMAAFASRFAAEMRRAQLADGGFPNMAPNALKMLETVPGWGEASGIWMVWAHYLTYGDRRLLAQHYPAARRWAERLAATCPERISRGFTFGDWLNGETVLVDGWQRNGCAVPMQVMGTACFGRSAAIVAAMARAVGEPGDAARFERLFGEFRDAFTREFVDQDGRILGDTQAGYAIALAFGMLPESRHAAARTHLAAAIARAGGRLTTGNITSHLLLQELSQSGRHDLAVRLVTNPDCPSWGYMLRHGATAIWERWDGFLEERQGPIERPRWQALHPWETHVVEGPFQDPGMNSYNHPGYLLVAQWMVESILGIAPSAAGPAFRRFTVRPQIGALRYARGSYRSLHGVIRVAWHRAGDRLTLNITVPPGTRAEAHVPCVSADRLRESGGDVAAAVGVAVCGYQAGRAQLELLPGAYRFESEIGAQGMLQGRDER